MSITTQGGSSPDDLPEIRLSPPITPVKMADALGIKSYRVLSHLMELGYFASLNTDLSRERDILQALSRKYHVLFQSEDQA